MTLAQQQQFIALGLSSQATGLQSLEELAGATLRVDYSLPGWFEWRPWGPGWFQWVLPTGQGQRMPRPLLRERTREAALEAARRYYPPVAAAMVQAARFIWPQATEAQTAPQGAQIVPTALGLQIIYIPGASNQHILVVVDGSESHFRATWDE
jgi:hypothetical protein